MVSSKKPRSLLVLSPNDKPKKFAVKKAKSELDINEARRKLSLPISSEKINIGFSPNISINTSG